VLTALPDLINEVVTAHFRHESGVDTVTDVGSHDFHQRCSQIISLLSMLLAHVVRFQFKSGASVSFVQMISCIIHCCHLLTLGWQLQQLKEAQKILASKEDSQYCE